MKNFIVPIDFSEDSLKGIEIARLFSHQHYVNVQMVYVQEYPQNATKLKLKEEHNWAEENFHRILSRFEPQFGHESKLRYIIKKGKIYQEILNQAHSYKDSIITASTQGTSGFEELFIGSNAYKMIVASDRPVITIRNAAVPTSIKRIIIPIVLGKNSRQKVPYVAELAKLFGAEVHIIGISNSKGIRSINTLKGHLCQIMDYFDERKIQYSDEILTGADVNELAIEHANNMEADLMVIVADRSAGLNLVVGTWGHQIINRCNKMVMSLPPKQLRIKSTFKTTG